MSVKSCQIWAIGRVLLHHIARAKSPQASGVAVSISPPTRWASWLTGTFSVSVPGFMLQCRISKVMTCLQNIYPVTNSLWPTRLCSPRRRRLTLRIIGLPLVATSIFELSMLETLDGCRYQTAGPDSDLALGIGSNTLGDQADSNADPG